MSPEEKAKEVLDKYLQLHAYPTMSAGGNIRLHEHSKESALIAVNEIIDAITELDNKLLEWEGVSYDSGQYWHFVKQHIENL